MKKRTPVIIAVILLLSALCAVLYPTVSEWINKLYAKEAVVAYNHTIDTLSESERRQYYLQARRYNTTLSNSISDGFSKEAFQVNEEYDKVLNITEDGQMGTVEIPMIDCSLPVYHGSNEEMLSKGAVHLAKTSLPIGGKSNHAVISAHTAYPGRVFFDRLTEMKIGDVFYVTVLGVKMAYQVTEINVVLPTDTEKLQVVKDRDLVTLSTCTPYAVNTYRLLVTGERFDETEVPIEIDQSDRGEDSSWIYCLAALPVPCLMILILRGRRKKREKQKMA